MSVYFIDFQGFCTNERILSIKELCIMSTNIVFEPMHYVFESTLPRNTLSSKVKHTNRYLSDFYHKIEWEEGTDILCPTCIIKDLNVTDSIFYVLDKCDGNKLQTLKKFFPMLRLVNYSKNSAELPTVPENIRCVWREHGQHCAYKHCLAMCIDYCSLNE